jgi:RimJ/RimL family protein N-acetyltransferase
VNYWQGEHIRLRAVEPEDGKFFYEALNEASIQNYVSDIRIPMSLKACQDWAVEEAAKGNNRESTTLIIEDSDQNSVGMIDPQSLDRRVGVFTCGIWIKPEFLRKGYASEALTLVLRFYFEQLGYQKFNSSVFSYNTVSIKLHEKMGFTYEGRIRRDVLSQGKYYDTHLYGMTIEEYSQSIGMRVKNV